MDTWMMVLFGAGGLLAVLLLVRRAKAKQQPSDRWPVQRQKLLGDRSSRMFARLREALPDCTVLVQVPFDQILTVRRDAADRDGWKRLLGHHRADFVVCRSDLAVIAVVELGPLNGSSLDQDKGFIVRKKALMDAGIRHAWFSTVPTLEELCAGLSVDRPATHRLA